MPNNTTSLGFFGNSDIRWQVLGSIWSYFVIGVGIIVFNIANLALPFIVAEKDIKRHRANNGRCHVPSATLVGGLSGYVVGAILNANLLGSIKPEYARSIYTFHRDESLKGLEVGDPEVALQISKMTTFIFAATTFVGIGAAHLAVKAHQKCRQLLPSYNALRTRYTRLDNSEITSVDPENISHSAGPQLHS